MFRTRSASTVAIHESQCTDARPAARNGASDDLLLSDPRFRAVLGRFDAPAYSIQIDPPHPLSQCRAPNLVGLNGVVASHETNSGGAGTNE